MSKIWRNLAIIETFLMFILIACSIIGFVYNEYCIGFSFLGGSILTLFETVDTYQHYKDWKRKEQELDN